MLPKGHDWTMTIRYKEERRPPGLPLIFCHDDGRPIPAGARCYRRLDARQDYPTICLPCHEKLERQRYRRARVLCAGCDEPLKWEADQWLHEDGAVWKLREEECDKCAGAGCRYCTRGKVQVRDHEAGP